MAYWKRKQDNGRNSSNGSSIVHYKKPMEDVGIVEELLLKLDVICREKANSAPTLTSPPTFIDLQIYKIRLLKLTLNDKKKVYHFYVCNDIVGIKTQFIFSAGLVVVP